MIALKKILKTIFSYFLQGLIIIIPIGLTIILFKWIFTEIDTIINFDKPGLGFIIILSFTTIIGFLGSKFFSQPILEFIDKVFEKTPGVKLIYSLFKDIMEASIGNKKKFTEPVMVEFNPGIYRVGFLTAKDLKQLSEDKFLEDYIGVLILMSYSVAGNLFIVEKSKIKVINGNSSSVLKFVVSGGVADME